LAQASAGSFGQVAAEYLKRHVEAKKLRTGVEVKRMLDKLVLPAWKDRSFRELKRSDVTELLDGIADKNGARVRREPCKPGRRLLSHEDAGRTF
jgi:hypothetical protein